VSNGHTLVIGGWTQEGKRGYMLATPIIRPANAEDAQSEIVLRTQVVGAPESFWDQIGWAGYKSDTRRSTLAGVLAPGEVQILLEALKDTADAELSNLSTTTNRDGEIIGFGFSADDGAGAGALINLNLSPYLTADGQAVNLALRPSAVTPDSIHSSLRKH